VDPRVAREDTIEGVIGSAPPGRDVRPRVAEERRAVDALFGQIGQAIASFFSQPIVRLGLFVGVGYLVIVWLAAALWAFGDMRRRTVNPVWAYVSAVAVVLASPLLFPFAVLVHVVLRPSTTVGERRLEALRDAALRVEIERSRCPRCGRVTEEDWLICPSCRTTLAHHCEQCGHAVGSDWEACGWCGASLGPPAGVVARR
jgi:RNA polymerase subunit RPABC4/transcription elongation factor Spt4